MKLFRSMKEDVNRMPMVGSNGRMLGVRPGNASTPDVLAVQPSDLIVPNQGGMSVAPDNPSYLSRHRRPQSLGGTGLDPVWSLETVELAPNLQFRQDSPTHGLIEPLRTMTLQEYQAALSATRTRWKLACR